MPSWRLLRAEVRNGFENMAIDEAMLKARIEERVENTVRLFHWNPSAVSIGRFQDVFKETELDNCREKGVHVVRRISGGGAVYHDSEDELTYSVVAKQKDLGSYDVAENYRVICNGLIEGIRSLGLEADYSQGDRRNCPNVTVQGKKISGSAQAIRKGTILQHGTLLIDVDVHRMFQFLKVPYRGRGLDWTHRAREKITSLVGELGHAVSVIGVEEAVIQGFKKALQADLVEDKLSSYEIQLAEQLRVAKYTTELWNVEGKSLT